ncbi:expressed unknown protein [Ectocarpus siliculosus]|uniref:Uncharacterized protein n=1 Tax=Ectocarpus siliculosus TaxID=2880 RepID=D7FTI0_ECTSI|nr:expressed unknown protein [Ectocarpus siliculosus]|eukprot:CBJ48558.1 expressed unknown protein [Ectocarpus siliculosus]
MDVVDENQGSHGIIGSPVRRKVSAASHAASSASPLAERARDAQGVVMESQRQAAGGKKAVSGRSSTGSNSASKRARRTGKEPHGSRRETASNLELAGVLEALGSPSTGEVVMEEAAVGGEAVAACAKKSRMRHKRRMTADILDINNIFDDSMSSDGPAAAAAAAAAMAAASPPPRTGPAQAASPAGGSLTSSVYDGLDYVSSRSSGSRRSSLEGGGGADQMMAGAEEADGGDETADFSAIFKLVAQGTTPAGKNTRTPPGEGSQAVGAGVGSSSTPPPAGPPRARHHSNQKPGRDSLAQGLVEPASLPPGALGRVGSGAGGVKEVAPAANNPAAPTERVRRPKHSISRETPPDNWEHMAVPTPGPRHRDSLRPSHQPTFHSPNADSAASGTSGTPGSGSGETGDVGKLLADLSANSMISSAGGGSDEEDDGQYTAMNVDAVMAELESDGMGGRGEVRGCDDHPTAVDMDARVAELADGGGGGGTGGKKKRRNTAEKLTVDSLLGSLDSPPVQSSGGTRLAGTPRDSAEGGGATPLGAAEPSGVAATSEQPAVLLPKAAADAVALGDGSSSLASSSPGEQGAAAAATPGSGRSGATAVSMRGVFEPISPSLGGSADGEGVPVGGGCVVTPRFDRRVSGSVGGGRKDSGGTAGNGSVCGLLDSTPSPGGGLDQSFGEGEGRGKLPPMTGRAGAIAAILDSGTRGRRSSAKAGKNGRRNTCEPEEFGDVIADLDSEPDTPASSRDHSRVGEDAASPQEKGEPVETLSTPSSSSSLDSSPEASGPAAQQAEQEAGAKAGAGGPEESMDVDTDEDSFDSPGGGSEDENKPKERDDRRSTASPTTLGALLEDLGAQGEDETDEHGTVNSTEGVKASPPQENESGPSDDGVEENTSPIITHTPSPPVARRTRSKSPASMKRANVGEVGLASPRPAASARNKRSSMSISASPASKVSAPQPAPESARGRLKSCLSSRKRARGGPAGVASSSGRSPSASLGTPDLTNSAGTDGSLAMAGSSPSPSRGGGAAAGSGVIAGAPHGVKTPGPSSGVSGGGGGGGRGPASDMGLETPRRVMFGAPMAAEFNHLSPSNRLTPMPSRDAKSLFPLEKQEEAETDEDEDTAANSAQLAEWEGVEPMGEGDLEFDDFDGVNGAGSMFSPEQEAFSKASPR